MRFVQFCHKGGFTKLGVQIRNGTHILDLNAADTSLPETMIEFLRGHNKQDRINKILDNKKSDFIVPLAEVKLLAPILCPDKVICVGSNYGGHCREIGSPQPKEPIFFSKFSSSIIGPSDDIRYPTLSAMVDWEIELAVVIGKEGSNILPNQCQDHIFGYTIAQDISARDWQKKLNGGQFLLGKSMDTFCPLGPAIVTKDEIPDVYNLRLRTLVNNVVKQESTTGDMIHRIEYLISRFSGCITLLPGDVILTGTPAGVGVARCPPEFLKPGDVIRSEIEKIGFMENVVVSKSI